LVLNLSIDNRSICNKASISNRTVVAFNEIKQQYPSIVYPLKAHPIKGYSNPLPAACFTVPATCLSHIVANDKRRALYYLYIKLKSLPDKLFSI
jgi:hypothetical protein